MLGQSMKAENFRYIDNEMSVPQGMDKRKGIKGCAQILISNLQ